MTGVVWVVQLTQYPSFHWFDNSRFVGNHDRYRIRIAIIATPAMSLEMVSSALLLFSTPTYVGRVGAWAGMTLTLLIWISMFFVQVPLHEKLTEGFDAVAAGRLVKTNWVRTVAWTVRSVLLVYWTFTALSN